MDTVYFLGNTGGVKIRPTSIKNKEMWKAWYEEKGFHEVSRDEYDVAKKVFGKLEQNQHKDSPKIIKYFQYGQGW